MYGGSRVSVEVTVLTLEGSIPEEGATDVINRYTITFSSPRNVYTYSHLTTLTPSTVKY